MHGTLDKVGVDASVPVLDVFPSARPLPDAVRASLEAVKAAQLAARERARRETWQARAVVGGVAAVVVIGALVIWPRIRAGKAASAASVLTTALPPGQTTTGTQNGSSATDTTVLAPGGLLAAGVADLATRKEASAAVATPGSSLFDDCGKSYLGRRWRAAAAACATAFAARPDDAKLALRVAEAEYARDNLAEAGEWARRTLALDAKQADALAILGHSEQRTGHGEAAARAYRRYLALAPRGWHATEARAALRKEHANKRLAVPTTAAAATADQPHERDEGAPPRLTPAPEPAATAPAAFPLPYPAPGDSP